MNYYFIIFSSITNPDTGDAVIESTEIAAESRSDAIGQFYQDMSGQSFEIISVTQSN